MTASCLWRNIDLRCEFYTKYVVKPYLTIPSTGLKSTTYMHI